MDTQNTEAPDANTLRLNAGLALIDKAVQTASFSPTEQLGMLFLAHVLATRRLLKTYGITDRGKRLRVIKAAVGEFEKKLRTHVKPTPDPADVTTAEERPEGLPPPEMLDLSKA